MRPWSIPRTKGMQRERDKGTRDCVFLNAACRELLKALCEEVVNMHGADSEESGAILSGVD